MSVLARNLQGEEHKLQGVPPKQARKHLPVRILHVISRLGTGGTENVVLKLIHGLEEETFEHHVLALRGVDPAFHQEQLTRHTLSSQTRERVGFQFFAICLTRAMRACKPHIVHSRNWGAIEAIPAARLAGVPVAIHSEHGYELDMLAGLPNRRRIFSHAAYGMADAVFTVSSELREYHARQAWVQPHCIQVLYNGVDTRKFAPRPEQRKALRRKFCLPESRFIVGTVGRMVPIKDHPTLLRAIEILVRCGVDAHAVLVGAGREFDRNRLLVEKSRELTGRVTFVGASEAIPEALNTMDVFALPSISEGMSNTLLEAMASGLPVVATRVGGTPEVIEDGRSGWLFNPGDAEGLAEHLLRLASQERLREAYGAAARLRAVERFSLERMLQDYSQLYLDLVSRRGIKIPNQ